MQQAVAEYTSASGSLNGVGLWIDDCLGESDACMRLLILEGLRVEHARSGALGIARATGSHFDFILLDLRLPDLSGLEVLHELRRAAVHAPVGIVSGFLTDDAVLHAKQFGAAAFLTKPVDCDEVIALVRRLVNEDTIHSPAQHAGDRDPQNTFAACRRVFERAEHLSDPQTILLRAVLAVLIDQTSSTLAFGACVLAFRILQPNRALGPDELLSRLRTIFAKADVRERIRCPGIVTQTLAKLDSHHGTTRPESVTEDGDVSQPVQRHAIRAATDTTYREWKRILRVRPVLAPLARTDEQVAQIAYGAGYEHPSQLDHDFAGALGVTPKLFRQLCRDLDV